MATALGRCATFVVLAASIGSAAPAAAQPFQPAAPSASPGPRAFETPPPPQGPVFPSRVYERRSNGLLALGVVLASMGGSFAMAGVIIYGQAEDPCLEKGLLQEPAPGLFCAAERTTYDVGMGLIVGGGLAFALGLPLAVVGGSGAAVDARTRSSSLPRVRIEPRATGFRVVF